MAIAFKPSTPATTMHERRRVWHVKDNLYEVISRDGRHRYQVFLLSDGRALCDCVAGRNDRDCWHAQLVRERRAS